ncbi:MAG: nitroreductase family protein, partial [Erysipelotrichaceae bacterium]|nr:nitroreductase family protein [Erysipelotrichaceae bacterium]
DVWGGYDLGLQNAYLLLKAKEMGYDTLIMGLRDVEKIRAYFNIPEDEMVLPVIAIGKAGEEPALRPRKDLSEILKVV